MKVKALRTRKEPKEFVHIDVNRNLQVFVVLTSNIPNLMPETATMEGLKDYFSELMVDVNVDWDDYELVEFDLIEAGEVGADIRNKLSPPKNLVEMLEIFFEPKIAHVSEERAELAKLIQKEMKQTKVSIEYLAKLI